MTSSVGNSATQTTPSAQGNNGVFNAVLKRISDLKNRFLRKCGIYIDLLKLYTPVGSVLDKFRGPKTLEQWDPSKHMTEGFLSGSIPLPDLGQGTPSLKPSNVSRITTWFSSTLLQAGKLALTPGNDKLENNIKLFKSAIASKDQMLICHAAKNLAARLLSPSVLNQMQTKEKQNFVDYMKLLVRLIATVEGLHHLDRKALNLPALNKNNSQQTYKLPKNATMFLDAAIKQAAPEIARDQMTQDDLEKAHNASMVNRKIVEAKLHFICRQLEPAQTPLANYAQETDNTIEALKKMLNVSLIPDDQMILLLKALRDDVNDRKSSQASPLIELIIQEAPKLFHKELTATKDDIFLLRQVEVYELLNSKPELQIELVQHLNKLLSSAVQKVGRHMTMALTEQGEKDPSTSIRPLVENLIQNHAFSTTQIQALISPNEQGDFLQLAFSGEELDDTEDEQEETMNLGEFVVPEPHDRTRIEQPSNTNTFREIKLTKFQPDSLSSKIKIPNPKDFELTSSRSKDCSIERPPSQQLIVLELNNILQQMPKRPEISRFVAHAKAYKNATLPTSAAILSDFVKSFVNTILPRIPSVENQQHIELRLRQLLMLESLEEGIYQSEQNIQNLKSKETADSESILFPPTTPEQFWEVAARVSTSMCREKDKAIIIRHETLTEQRNQALRQCIIHLTYKTMEYGISYLDKEQGSPQGQKLESVAKALAAPLPIYSEEELYDDMLSAMEYRFHLFSSSNPTLVAFILKSFSTICPEIRLESPLNPNGNDREKLKEILKLFNTNPEVRQNVLDYVNNTKNTVIENVSNQMLKLIVNPTLKDYTVEFTKTLKDKSFSIDNIKVALENQIATELWGEESDTEGISIFKELNATLTKPMSESLG